VGHTRRRQAGAMVCLGGRPVTAANSEVTGRLWVPGRHAGH
jgi:hypothetical protein